MNLPYPWFNYQQPLSEPADTPDERAVRFLRRLMSLLRSHGRTTMGTYDKKLEGRQVLKGEQFDAALQVLVSHGVVSRVGAMVILSKDWEDYRFDGKGRPGMPQLEDHIAAWQPVLDAIAAATS